jgi:hypothetical protein
MVLQLHTYARIFYPSRSRPLSDNKSIGRSVCYIVYDSVALRTIQRAQDPSCSGARPFIGPSDGDIQNLRKFACDRLVSMRLVPIKINLECKIPSGIVVHDGPSWLVHSRLPIVMRGIRQFDRR